MVVSRVAGRGGLWAQMSLQPPGNSPGACMPFLADPNSQRGFLFVALGIGVSGGTSIPLPPTPTILGHLRPRSSSLPGLTGKLLCIPPGSGYGCRGDIVMLQDEHVTSGARRRLSPSWGCMLDPVHTL